ncbi:MAG: fibronectin type III domain-containing protein [Candidatus Scalindua sp.]|nr:fibronectin type III domain-containing protein [Candidatus Scalindua sp.]
MLSDYNFPKIGRKSFSFCSPAIAILLFSLLSCTYYLHAAGVTTAIADFFVVHLGSAVTINPTASDPDGDTLSFSYSDWMSSSNYVTRLGDAGTHAVTVTVSDGSLTDSRNVTVNVNYYSQATLTWDANTESDLSGYRLYYGTSSGSYSNNIDVGNKTSHSLFGLKSGQTYYIVTRAYDSSGNESDDSNEEIFTAPLFSDSDGDDFPDSQEAFPADPNRH